MTGIERIAKERNRQIEHWTAKHDDKHVDEELASVAVCYIEQAQHRGQCIWQEIEPDRKALPRAWPITWHQKYWKPEPRDEGMCPMIHGKDAIRMLEKAGALIAVEIDRIQRLED